MGFNKLKSVGRDMKTEIKAYQLVLKDSRTPKLPKFLLGLAVGYMLLPFDIIPDFIPIIGQLDDIIIVPFLVIMALNLIPQDVIDDCRIRAKT